MVARCDLGMEKLENYRKSVNELLNRYGSLQAPYKRPFTGFGTG